MPARYYAESNDLGLRTFRTSDAFAIYEYASDEQVTKFTHWQKHKEINDTKEFITNRSIYDGSSLLLGIEHKKDKKIIGECGFITIDYPCAEIYYALSRYYWGNGLATQAVQSLLDYGFNSLFLTRIEAWIIADNFGSHRVAQKVGMHCETVLYDYWYTDNKQYDICVYVKEFNHHKNFGDSTNCVPSPFVRF